MEPIRRYCTLFERSKFFNTYLLLNEMVALLVYFKTPQNNPTLLHKMGSQWSWVPLSVSVTQHTMMWLESSQ